MIKESLKTALEFYRDLNDRHLYKLVNGLFVVKYIDDEVSVYVGNLIKGKKNKIEVWDNRIIYKYNKKKNLMTTSLGIWKPLTIGFKETPIEDILKQEEYI